MLRILYTLCQTAVLGTQVRSHQLPLPNFKMTNSHNADFYDDEFLQWRILQLL